VAEDIRRQGKRRFKRGCYVAAGGKALRMGAVSLRASRKGIVSLVARRRGRTLCQDVAGESSRKGPVSLQAARHHLEAEPIQR
jgi:hypothetical protein